MTALEHNNAPPFTSVYPLTNAAFHQIPFLELVEAHEVKKVRYKLLGGTPFAKTDINEVGRIRAYVPTHAAVSLVVSDWEKIEPDTCKTVCIAVWIS